MPLRFRSLEEIAGFSWNAGPCNSKVGFQLAGAVSVGHALPRRGPKMGQRQRLPRSCFSLVSATRTCSA